MNKQAVRHLPQRRCKAYYIKPEEPGNTENTEDLKRHQEEPQKSTEEGEDRQPIINEQIKFPQVLYAIYGGMAGLDIITLNIKNGSITDYAATTATLHMHHTVINVMTEKFYSTGPIDQIATVKEANLELLRKRSEIYNILSKKIRQI